MERKKKVGKCHLCGKVKSLSLEHVPPRSAFNKEIQKMYQGDQLIGSNKLPWDFSDLSSEEHQNGVGWNTLCVECNNNTGGWYTRSYADFVAQSYLAIEKDPPILNRPYKIKLINIYPSRVAKQIVAMFLSINPGLSDKNGDLRKLLQDKVAKGINIKKYGLGLYINASTLAKYIPISGLFKGDAAGFEIISELSTIPFGYMMKFSPMHMNGYTDITGWLNFGYNECAYDLELTTMVYDSNTPFPMDYRSKEEIKKQSSK